MYRQENLINNSELKVQHFNIEFKIQYLCDGWIQKN